MFIKNNKTNIKLATYAWVVVIPLLFPFFTYAGITFGPLQFQISPGGGGTVYWFTDNDDKNVYTFTPTVKSNNMFYPYFSTTGPSGWGLSQYISNRGAPGQDASGVFFTFVSDRDKVKPGDNYSLTFGYTWELWHTDRSISPWMPTDYQKIGWGSVDPTITVSVVPAPSAVFLVASGLAGVIGLVRKRILK